LNALCAVIGLALSATMLLPAASDPDIGGRADDDELILEGFDRGESSGPARPASSSGDDGPPVQYTRAPLCVSTTSRSDLTPSCPNGDPIVETCLDGSDAVDPLWRRMQRADGTWTEWAVVQMYTCPGDAPLLAAIEREWTQLRPQPSEINLQPNTGWVIATVPTVAMAGDAPRLHSATLLGAAVEIRATASGYRWSWGDGSHTETSDPGSPYPDASLTHTYPHAADLATVALTTTWTGEYRVNGGPWLPFDSTINSTSTPVDLTIYDPRSRLVDCNLGGQCHIDASG
jgi:hypothetical protein